MSDGTTKPIEQVKVGDSVLSKNEKTGEIAAKKVSNVSVRADIWTRKLSFDNGAILETTDEHPLYVEGSGFVKTKGEFAFDQFGTPYAFGSDSGSVYAVQIIITQEAEALLIPFANPNGTAFFRIAPSPIDINPFLIPGVTAVSGKQLVDLDYSRAPGARDLPVGNTLPVSDGSWRGQLGESIWDSTKDAVRQVDAQVRDTQQLPLFVPVEFERRYPDFSPWLIKPDGLSTGSVTIDIQKGYSVNIPNPYRGNTGYYYDVDLMEADKKLAQTWGWRDAGNEPDFWRVWNWRENTQVPPVTWHHHEDMKTMQLVPKDINNQIPHQGGRPFGKAARW